ncbi:MAG: hypothetical protein ACLTQI_04930 [Slackia sp.]
MVLPPMIQMTARTMFTKMLLEGRGLSSRLRKARSPLATMCDTAAVMTARTTAQKMSLTHSWEMNSTTCAKSSSMAFPSVWHCE